MTREHIIEVMARAYAKEHGPLGPTMEENIDRQNKTWRRYAAEMATAYDALVSAGLAVVPVEPTEEMLFAAHKATNGNSTPDNNLACYHAMIEATKKPAGVSKRAGE